MVVPPKGFDRIFVDHRNATHLNQLNHQSNLEKGNSKSI